MDLVGVGIGPFNLSLAALLTKVNGINSQFYDRKMKFSWHQGLLLDEAEIQVNYLKDLVSLVDPTNPYSFIAYLAFHKRLYRFITAKFNKVLRKEFNDYMSWVSKRLNNLNFNEDILNISYENKMFVVTTDKQIIHCKHLVLGNGLNPTIPSYAASLISDNIFHGEAFLNKTRDLRNKRILIVGGGQSGAEIFYHLLRESNPASLTWISKNPILPIMDDSAFANEYFTPDYVDYFYGQPFAKREALLGLQKHTSDGISQELLQEIYQLIYRYEYVDHKKNMVKIINEHELTQLNKTERGYSYTLKHCTEKCVYTDCADIVIFCTGYHWKFPDYLLELKHLIEFEGHYFKTNKDYSIAWEGNPDNRIYVQNAARHSHGISDPNLSLMAWRSATIINSIANKNIYDLDCGECVMSFEKYCKPENIEVSYAKSS